MSSPAEQVNVTVRRDDPDSKTAFTRLNERWMRESFSWTESELLAACDPDAIWRRDGHIFAAFSEGKVLGVVALWPTGSREFELGRLCVDARYRGQGMGRCLVAHALEYAQSVQVERVILLSNRKLEAALGLYRSLGFRRAESDARLHQSRCDVFMEKWLVSKLE